MPYIVSQKDKSITVQVSSQYTFGKPVNGSARLRIIVNYYPKRKYQKDPDTGKYGYVDLTQPELIYDMQGSSLGDYKQPYQVSSKSVKNLLCLVECLRAIVDGRRTDG
ncbi:hypothetical protein LOTGIDRAFT_176613 [Lottia gigantea]|uniref:Macroglobulin domain-containing protein n=1 Tax=Lottia gigantea TaxID=225164 RepID=V4ARC3_LOTGI|nr:hypothetical protein LOTGIDRAFT_176613 [Lottia gigantea]ESO96261.1 hypothetical protein LOTGIDRAFT_176613 [Lottia gigantea]